MEELWKKRPEYALVDSLIRANNDVYLYGLPGIGKTTFINTIMKDVKARYIKINGITCQDKSGLLKSIVSKLSAEFDYEMPECLKMNSFIENLTYLISYLNEKELFNFEQDRFYIVFDNAEKMTSISAKYLSSLLKIKHILNINFTLIFISTCVEEKLDEFFYMKDMELVPKVQLNKPTREEIQQILSLYVAESEMFDAIKENPKKATALINDIAVTFSLTLHGINHFKTILKNMYHVIMANNILNQPGNFLSHKIYTALKKFYMDNPYAKITADELSKKIVELSYLELENFLNETSALEIRKCDIELSRIPAIILIACYLGNNNPEKTDKKLFKDYKRRNRKTKNPKEQKRDFQPIRFNRLLALTQSMISVIFEDFPEIQQFDQSIDFYSQVNMLVEMGYITKFSLANNEFEKIKFSCNLDFDTISALCKVHNIRLQDFLYQES